ncbi:uncharacterized protein PITG_15996 [Phytophthora infestans T30-4]|uniref:Uncharacterized protein n=1 Tax=Phytophthora infestans (strain T30-4) TaxID=403677 RepID=D0NSL8_PHYIT|nr:uncharacterized protein PITG_15996 [Phytophthora infestans T30-4]EEY64580.1 hypothetical protein PITG_15996 [Phytophthora infestans T30-4]|eukprot:XP_002897780.1 hypothetical protein PITG_15996 [Phytophthora infestans T30-4]
MSICRIIGNVKISKQGVQATDWVSVGGHSGLEDFFLTLKGFETAIFLKLFAHASFAANRRRKLHSNSDTTQCFDLNRQSADDSRSIFVAGFVQKWPE